MHLGLGRRRHCRIIRVIQDIGDQVRHLARFIFLEPARVIAGEPMRMPEVTNGLSGSLGIAFLLTVICASPSSASAAFPVKFLGRKSTMNICDSYARK